MEDISVQDTNTNSLSDEASHAAAGGQVGRGVAVSELIDHLAAQFGNIAIDETVTAEWFNDLARPMPPSSDAPPATAPQFSETGQQAEDRFVANLVVVSELAELPVLDTAKKPGTVLVFDEDRQLAASVATLLAAVSASSLSFDSDLQFWAAIGLKMQLKGFERLNPAHDYRREYKKLREEAVAVYGDIAEDRGRFAEVVFPAQVRTREQEEHRRMKMARRYSEKAEREKGPGPNVLGERRSARLRRRREKRNDQSAEKFEMDEMGKVLEAIGDSLPLAC